MIENTYPIELKPLDISAYRRGNTGVDYFTTFDSGRPGPHVMINALTHGNELCGVHALDFLFRKEVRPALGKLTLGFSNVEAYTRFEARDPNASRYVDEDFNRIWDLDKLEGDSDSKEKRRAREMRPLVDGVDYLLDIHSMLHDTPALLLPGRLEKGKALARGIGTPAYVVIDQGHASGRRLRDYGAFADPARRQNALLVECGQHWSRRSAQVAIETAVEFLFFFKLLDADARAGLLPEVHYPEQKFIEITDAVTITTNEFSFVEAYRGMEVIPTAGTVIARDGELRITTPYDDCILIMPSKRLQPGLTAVRLGRSC